MFTWKKLGQIFNPSDYPRDWMQSHAQCTSTLIFDDFVRVYFSCRPAPDKDGQYLSYTAFCDLDRKDLTKVVRVADKPVLPLGELGAFDEYGIYPTCVVRINEKETALYYGGWSRCQSIPFTVSIGLAFGDGETFTRQGRGPVLTRSLYEPFTVSGPKVRLFDGRWYMYYLAVEKWEELAGRVDAVYKIRMAVSDDGMEWRRFERDIIPTVLYETECQAGPDVFFRDDTYHMYFSYRYAFDFRNNDRGYRIGYAWSDDAIHWTRDDKQAGIGLSESGWDSQMQHYPHVFEVDGQTYMLYNGNEFGRHGFGLAREAR